MTITGTKLESAFKALRAQGYTARANFKCCSSCAGAALANSLEQKIQKAKDTGKDAKTTKGVVYYHQQDNDAVRAHFAGKRGEHTLCLRYGCVDTTKFGTIGQTTLEVGYALKTALQNAGITVEWSGNADETIVVNCAEAFAPATN